MRVESMQTFPTSPHVHSRIAIVSSLLLHAGLLLWWSLSHVAKPIADLPRSNPLSLLMLASPSHLHKDVKQATKHDSPVVKPGELGELGAPNSEEATIPPTTSAATKPSGWDSIVENSNPTPSRSSNAETDFREQARHQIHELARASNQGVIKLDDKPRRVPLPHQTETPRQQLARQFSEAYIDRSTLITYFRYRAPDGTIITRQTMGGKSVCYTTESQTSRMPTMPGFEGRQKIKCPPIDDTNWVPF